MNDVFISYAHIDDQALTEGQKGWITQFHRILEVRLGQLLGEKPTIGVTKSSREVMCLMTRSSMPFGRPKS